MQIWRQQRKERKWIFVKNYTQRIVFRMELQNIHMSIFYILLPDYLLHLLRMIGIMSSPIHDHFRCAAAASAAASRCNQQQPSATAAKQRVQNPVKEDNSVLLDTLHHPQPLAAAMYSLQLVANVVNSALQRCTTVQKPVNGSLAGRTGIPFDTSSGAPSFCYFFIDMQPQSGNNCKYTAFNCEPCDYENVADCQHLSTAPFTVEQEVETEPETDADADTDADTDCSRLSFQRQRSISECSDDSFICFEDDSNDRDDCATIDKGTTDYKPDCTFDSEEQEEEQEHELAKKVRFNLKPKIHIMHTWDFAYRAARKGDWQVIARDRDRFQQRIKRLAPTINVILSSKHRDKVYRDRFLDVK